jgi:(2R)-ethylmalonyl-CoA mutase
VPDEDFGEVVARISFFVNAGVRFVEEMCKMRAFVQLWDDLTRERYRVSDPKQRRFRYGVQVNSLGLTEAQPENNVQRIVLEMLGVTLSKDARARAVQLPAWNEALGLPRPWDQQWSLRLQQVLAFESGYMKSALVASHSARRRRIEAGEDVAVGLNRFTTTEPNPLTADLDTAIQRVDPQVERAAVRAVRAWREERDADPVRRARAEAAVEHLRADAASARNLMPATLECARAELTTGEWARALRQEFGEYRAPTGVSGSVGIQGTSDELVRVRAAVTRTGEELGERLRVLVGKPGLDGHSNGAEQVAVRARDAGFEVVYQGIRLTPQEIVAAAAEDVHLVGLSILSGSHLELVPEVLAGMRAAGICDVPLIVGGIIPESDAAALTAQGVAAAFTPKDFGPDEIMGELVSLIRVARGLDAEVPDPALADDAPVPVASVPLGGS